MGDLRTLIKQVLAEEFASLRAELACDTRVERVSVGSSAELKIFALSVVDRANDPGFVSALREGRMRFVPEAAPALSTTSIPVARPVSDLRAAQPMTLVTSVPAAVPELIKPLITERDIAAIGEGQTRLRVGRQSRLTPLAGDEVRRRGIRIERIAT